MRARPRTHTYKHRFSYIFLQYFTNTVFHMWHKKQAGKFAIFYLWISMAFDHLSLFVSCERKKFLFVACQNAASSPNRVTHAKFKTTVNTRARTHTHTHTHKCAPDRPHGFHVSKKMSMDLIVLFFLTCIFAAVKTFFSYLEQTNWGVSCCQRECDDDVLCRQRESHDDQNQSEGSYDAAPSLLRDLIS
jgi:hypothetical protein